MSLANNAYSRRVTTSRIKHTNSMGTATLGSAHQTAVSRHKAGSCQQKQGSRESGRTWTGLETTPPRPPDENREQDLSRASTAAPPDGELAHTLWIVAWLALQ